MVFYSQILLLLFSLLTYSELAISSITTDKEALISFKSSLILDPQNNPLSNWAPQSPLSPCNWTGVQCNAQAQRVVGLDLSSLGLSGPLSPQIGNLSSLQFLNLHNNRFGGPIPHEITKLSLLRVLNMSSNFFEGVLPPRMSELRELEAIDLMANKITGKIPEEISELKKLEVLKLGRNRLFGEIPRSLANVSALTTLNLGTNNLGGPLPSEFGQLRNLKELDITINNLTGIVPPSLYNLTSLVNFALASNNLWGEIPQNIGETLPNLLMLNFCINKFTGRIPASLHNLTMIRGIRMADNLLEGPVPPGLENLPFLEMYNIGFNDIVSSGDDGLSFITSLTNSSHLHFLAIDGNRLEGLIPHSIGNLSKTLSKLYMGGNRIYGEIPSSIARLTGLALLNLSSNSITGRIPSQLGELSELQELSLANNNIKGSIPSSLGNLMKLNGIDLSGNSLVGSVPISFGNFRRLLSMDLSNNKLDGKIPKECLNLPSLATIFNLSNNLLSGPLPEEIGLLQNIVTIDLSNNLLTGQIPSSIEQCESLEELIMRNNRFFGPIPKSIAEVKGLEVLDLSSNQLSGSIPIELQNLQALKYLNLSFNNLDGSVPKAGVFKNASSINLQGNKRLCFDGLACLSAKSGANTKRAKIVFVVCVVVTILALCLAIGVFLYFRKSPPKIADSLEEDYRGKRDMVSYQELRRATGDFSHENLVGKGGFGSVYKGRLREGVTVAVKVLNTGTKGSLRSFFAECEALKSVRHRNLVELITSCSSVDSKNTEFLALVYEYMSNGSLEDWIKGKRRSENREGLSVLERLSIAIDVACALDYLHNDCEVPVVHCDIKPSNILLDEDLVAKVCDFGLARLIMEKIEGQTSITSTNALKGSIGYIPPEYGLGEKPSTVGDVYSFGVMLLELFTGMSPLHESFSAELNLPRWVHSALSKDLAQVVDPELSKSLGSAESECLSNVFEVGLCCTRNSKNERMTIRNALQSLDNARHNLVKHYAIETPEVDRQVLSTNKKI